MITRGSFANVVFLPAAAFVTALLFLATTARAQNAPVDLTTTCGGQSCFNAAGLYSTGTTFIGTFGMDGGGDGCSLSTACSDAYSSDQLGLSSATPPALTPPSLNVPFIFGPVNTQPCSPTVACIPDMVRLPATPMTISLPSGQQTVYSTLIMLGTAVQGSHTGTVTVNYTDSTADVFTQTFSDWCGFSGNKYESVAVSQNPAGKSMNRINSDGTLNGAGCNLYAYSYPVNFNKTVASIALANTDGTQYTYVLAITLKPPTYTIEGGVANPTTVPAGTTSTATITLTPQPGYIGTVQLSCNISPNIVTSSAATAPTCTLNPTSVDVTADETSPPTTMLTFTASKPSKAVLERQTSNFYAFWLVPGLALSGLGFGSRSSLRKRLFGLLLPGILLAGVLVTPSCVTYKHLGNVGTPPGQYTLSVTGVDQKGLSQASNPPGTSNAVVVTVTD